MCDWGTRLRRRDKFIFAVVRQDPSLRHWVPYLPSLAALAMATTLVTLGVSLAKNGILTASRTQRQIFLTSSEYWNDEDGSLDYTKFVLFYLFKIIFISQYKLSPDTVKLPYMSLSETYPESSLKIFHRLDNYHYFLYNDFLYNGQMRWTGLFTSKINPTSNESCRSIYAKPRGP